MGIEGPGPAAHSAPAATRYLPWLLAVVAASIVHSGTPWGPGLTPDSMWYLRAAAFLGGTGQADLLSSHWPPGFPAVLAAVNWFTADLFTAGRLVQAGAAGASILVFSRLLESQGLSHRHAALAALVMLLQPAFLVVHFMLWSEPLFIALVLLDLLLLQRLLIGPPRWRDGVLLAMAVGAASMVRYAGVFLVLLNAVAILLLADVRRDFLRRLAVATVVSAMSLLPLLLWFLFNHLRGAGAANRALAWHPAGRLELAELALSVADWLQLPAAFASAALLLVAATILLSLAYLSRNSTGKANGSAVFPLGVIAYVGFLWTTISVIDYYTPLDQRILSPAFPIFAALLALLGWRFAGAVRRAAWLVLVPAVLLAIVGGEAAWQSWRSSRTEGLYLSSRRFQELPVLGLLRALPKDVFILSNGPELVELYVGRETAMLPSKYSPTSGLADQDYAEKLSIALAGAEVLVYFRPMARRNYLATPSELDRLPGVRRIYEDGEAIVWMRPATEPEPPGRSPAD